MSHRALPNIGLRGIMTDPGSITVKTMWLDSTVIMNCVGDLDITTAAVLERQIEEVLNRGPDAIVVDLTELDFLAARGMNVLIRANGRLSDRVKFLVVADGPKTRRPMTLIGVDSQVPLHSTRDTALAAVRRDPLASQI
ncbi:MAG: STAS domain-containing protein [Mycolicibacterium neoaurum]|uniref:STAS domain-containing protein n=1 Tax=Mycolicibacterium neoaurum TaxID=1795 RepID=UPI002FF9E9FA